MSTLAPRASRQAPTPRPRSFYDRGVASALNAAVVAPAEATANAPSTSTDAAAGERPNTELLRLPGRLVRARAVDLGVLDLTAHAEQQAAVARYVRGCRKKGREEDARILTNLLKLLVLIEEAVAPSDAAVGTAVDG